LIREARSGASDYGTAPAHRQVVMRGRFRSPAELGVDNPPVPWHSGQTLTKLRPRSRRHEHTSHHDRTAVAPTGPSVRPQSLARPEPARLDPRPDGRAGRLAAPTPAT